MKRKTILIAALYVAAGLFSGRLNAQIQVNTDVPHVLSYQGQVASTDGIPMNGTHHITASLYSDPYGKTSVWQGSYDVDVSAGVFSLMLGSGKSPLPGISTMNQPLWVGISVDRGEEMRPLSQLSSSPYALNVADRSITTAKLAPEVMANLHAMDMHSQNANSAVYWSETGNNSTTAGTNYVGTSDSVALELHVYDGDASAHRGSKRVMRYEPNSSSPNILGGYQGNLISHSAGSIIDGGGSNGQINEIRSSYSVISGGRNNLIDSNSQNSVIIAGGGNTIHRGAINSYLGSGTTGAINDGAQYSAIVGGSNNLIDDSCKNGFIGGGSNNTIGSKGNYGTITGGDHLTAQSYAQTVMGHYNSAQGTSTPTVINGNDRLLIIGNGTDADHKANAFEVTDSGTSLVYRTNKSGTSSAAPIGGTNRDNIIYAWGVIEDASTDSSGTLDYGVLSITHTPNSGIYLIKLNLIDPTTNLTTSLRHGAVALVSRDPAHDCGFLLRSSDLSVVSGITQFTVYTSVQSVKPPGGGHPDYWLGCDPQDLNFMFILTGRPQY